MIRRFHRGLGIGLGLLYVFWITHQGHPLPAFGIPASAGYTGKAGAGILVAYCLPLVAIVCFTEGAWYILGYVLLTIGVCVLLLFR